MAEGERFDMEAKGLLEETVLRLEMLRGEEDAFGPDNGLKLTHRGIPSSCDRCRCWGEYSGCKNAAAKNVQPLGEPSNGRTYPIMKHSPGDLDFYATHRFVVYYFLHDRGMDLFFRVGS